VSVSTGKEGLLWVHDFCGLKKAFSPGGGQRGGSPESTQAFNGDAREEKRKDSTVEVRKGS